MEGDHTYFVGDANGGLWVHNDSVGWITKDVFSTLQRKVGKESLKKFVEALKKGVVCPRGESGIKRLDRNVGEFTHELKIGNSGDRILGKMGEWRGQAMYIFSQLTDHLD